MRVEWYAWDYETGTYSDYPYLDLVGGGLTKSMADAENPKGETAYWTDGTKYYIMEYKNMKVCACTNVCGKNGFRYAMLWQQ